MTSRSTLLTWASTPAAGRVRARRGRMVARGSRPGARARGGREAYRPARYLPAVVVVVAGSNR